MAIQAKNTKTFALMIFILGVFMSALDNGIISSALTTITHSFAITEVQGTWGVTLYTLGMAISTPIIGKLADNFGRKKLFLFEITLFAFGSLLVALSPSFGFFLAARFIQSIGGGGIFIIASSHILSTYPKEKQGALLGVLGSINGIASVVGPNLGSLILNVTGHWSWLFLINLPLAIFVIISGFFAIPETKNQSENRLVYKGLVLLTFGILSFMIAITNLESGALLTSFLKLNVWGFVLLGIFLFILLVRVEKVIPEKVDPFLPYNLLKNQEFLLTLFMGLLSGTLIAVFVFIPSFVEHRYGIAANNSGVWMSGIGMGSILGASIGGLLVSKLGATRTITISGSLSVIGFALIAYLSPTTTWFLVSSTIAGIGFGMLMGAPFSDLMSEIAGKKDNGVALGTLSVSRQVGITIAPIIYATIVQSGFSTFADKLSPLKLYPNTNLSVEDIYLNIQNLSNSSIKEQAITLFRNTAANAYQHVFIFAVLAAAIIFIGGWYLHQKERSVQK